MYTDYYSLKGSAHELHRIPCEDKGIIFETKRLTVVAVSDGCSAYPNTDIAADLTIQGLKEFVEQHEKVIAQGKFSPDRFMQMLLTKLSHIYKDNCGIHPYRHMAATLAFLIIDRISWCYYVFSVGDSTALSVDCFGQVYVCVPPYPAPVFCCSYKEAMNSYQYTQGDLHEDGREAFLLLTDGGASAPHHAYGELVQSLSKHDVFERRIILKDFCRSVSKCTDDDITVAVILLGEAPIPMDDNELPKIEEEHNPFRELLNALREPISVQELVDKGIYPEGHLLTALIPLVSAGMVIRMTDQNNEIKYRLSDDMIKSWTDGESEEE